MATEPSPNPLLEAALGYAERRGAHVLPCWWPVEGGCACTKGRDCKRPGKHPIGRLVPNGLKNATADPVVIAGWWAQYPLASVAIRTGPESGLLVIDIDPRKGGDDELRALEQRFGALPMSVRALTGGGGAHIYLRYPEGRVIPSGVDVLGVGLDVRAIDGYVLAPPSGHVSGRSYAWDVDSASQLADAPAWLLERLTAAELVDKGAPPVLEEASEPAPAEIVDRARRYVRHIAPAIEGNQGHRQTLIAAMHVRKGFRLDREQAFEVLSTEFNPRCVPPWDDADLRRKVTEAEKTRAAWGFHLQTARPRPQQAVQPASTTTPAPTPVAALATTEPAAAVSWLDRLSYRENKRTGERALLPLLHNVALILENDEQWAGRIVYNEFGEIEELLPGAPIAEAPGRWTDAHSRAVCIWLQEQWHTPVTTGLAYEAVQAVARYKRVHPVRAYLESLTWDGVPRLDTWLEDLAGARRTRVAVATGRAWLISAVARVWRPGCKADHVLILEGPQGAGKSSLFRRLAEPWFTDEVDVLGSKDAALQVQGTWVVELAELDALHRSEISRTKAFLSKSFDRFRPPYGRTVLETQRQCVFGGSVNSSQYLRDETGGRRFWPIACGTIDLDGVSATRDQLWAEALFAFQQREKWWLTGEAENEVREEQEARYLADAWEDPIRDRIAEWNLYKPVTTAEVLRALGINTDKQDRASQMRVAAVLTRFGYKPFQRKVNGVNVRGWDSPEPQTAQQHLSVMDENANT